MHRPLYTPEHLLFAQSVRDFIAREVTPHNAQWEKNQMVSRESWLRFGEAGYLCLQVDEKYGGLGIKDFRYNAIITEELARTGAAGPAVGYPLHTDIVTPYLEHYGSEALKQKYLPKMVTGEYIGAIAMTEPGAGSDLQNIRTTAIDKGGYYLVNGSKTFITNGYLSDVVVVAVKTDPTQGAKGISMLVIDSTMKGFTKGKPFEKIGLHAQDTCELFFENVEVPKENLLGNEGEGFKYMMTELSQERLVVALAAIAAAEGVLEKTTRYTKERHAFGKPIAEFQNTRFKLAEVATEVTIGRVFADHCVALHCEKKLDQATASMAKYWLTDLQSKVADECLQLHGGYGYIWEYDVARAWADARVQRIYAGTNEIMKELIARKILK
ncbi:MAG: acyl-CoA dehydrogenase family protein [Chitinophagales bacterium]|nr:acyl-CoA dehydrogenase family protein [Chitinophagales bacterium]MDW8420012.1 acyl-CoA dehydrogenase family protein [Chitinophagales bacterium]